MAAYSPIGAQKWPYMHTGVVELNTGYDAGSRNRSLSPSSKESNLKGGIERVGSAWPAQSQRVASMTPLRASLFLFDVILASTPLMFVALALTAARLDGKEISQYGSRLAETLLLSPTIFPLIFAALMGRFFRHLGLWLAQRGTTLGRLEQLIGCQSVFSALELQVALRSWSIVGLLSVLVWLLSPIGGQSALRLFKQENKEIISTAQLRYMAPQNIGGSVMIGASAANGARSAFTSIFLAALLSSSKYQNTPMDLWGNVKLPLYRYIENSTSEEWKILANATSENISYASLIGIPVTGSPSNGVSEFTIQARQFDLTCSSNEAAANTSSPFDHLATWTLRPLHLNPMCSNITTCRMSTCEKYPCPIVSESLANEDPVPFSVAACEMSFDKYEAGVRCNGTACAVYKMRKMSLSDDWYGAGADKFTRNNFMGNIMTYMPTLDTYNIGSAAARGPTNMEKWINDPADFIGVQYNNVDLWKLPPDVFAERLTIIVNTFWQSTYGTTALGGNLPPNVTDTGVLIGSSYGTNVTFNATEANIVQLSSPVYKLDWRWFSVLLLCSLVLLAAAYMGLVLKYITLAPDIIGYASSLTLLNPYVPTPTGGTTLDGLERAALLHDLPVRIGDVCPNEPVGAIAFAKADGIGAVAGLDRKRLYV
ncbi:hypothetical protein BDW02DRAFT_646341 [Decorospora gaudefroyi]|uniref:Uncharacterized protein n=1 Tax=Decorospora gaudefroyi TaxID=184978 RepID=A0A6A5KR46_9PLEO|nr:hypothetical protein BDW02DRAFT_646341 [Decorospora gaudefroyi]